MANLIKCTRCRLELEITRYIILLTQKGNTSKVVISVESKCKSMIKEIILKNMVKNIMKILKKKNAQSKQWQQNNKDRLNEQMNVKTAVL